MISSVNVLIHGQIIVLGSAFTELSVVMEMFMQFLPDSVCNCWPQVVTTEQLKSAYCNWVANFFLISIILIN